jgi:hypothetical protein
MPDQAAVSHDIPDENPNSMGTTGNYFFLNTPTNSEGPLYWEMWPVDDGNGQCHFQTTVIGSAANGYPTLYTGQIYYNQTAINGYVVGYNNGLTASDPVTGNNIIGLDSGFCAAVLNESGYVTATTKLEPTVTFNSNSGAYSSFNMNLSSIFVGK